LLPRSLTSRRRTVFASTGPDAVPPSPKNADQTSILLPLPQALVAITGKLMFDLFPKPPPICWYNTEPKDSSIALVPIRCNFRCSLEKSVSPNPPQTRRYMPPQRQSCPFSNRSFYFFDGDTVFASPTANKAANCTITKRQVLIFPFLKFAASGWVNRCVSSLKQLRCSAIRLLVGGSNLVSRSHSLHTLKIQALESDFLHTFSKTETSKPSMISE